MEKKLWEAIVRGAIVRGLLSGGQLSGGLLSCSPLRHIILILSQPVFALSPSCCVLSGEATNTNFIVFGLTDRAWTHDLPHSRRACLTITPQMRLLSFMHQKLSQKDSTLWFFAVKIVPFITGIYNYEKYVIYYWKLIFILQIISIFFPEKWCQGL